MNDCGEVDTNLATALRDDFDLHKLVFEAPNRRSQVALLKTFGPGVNLANIPPAELLRVETFRRAIHADTIVERERHEWKKHAGPER